MGRGDGVLLIWNDIAPGMERAFRDWHDEEHIPERVGVPGFLSGRRFFADDAVPRWLTLYEARDAAVFSSPDYLARLNAPTPRTQAILPHFRGTQRMAGRVVASTGDGHGEAILTARIWLQGEASPNTAAIQRLVDGLAGNALAGAAVLSDSIATTVTTAERDLRHPDQIPPDLVLVVEGSASGAMSWPSRFDAILGRTRKQVDWFALETARVAG